MSSPWKPKQRCEVCGSDLHYRGEHPVRQKPPAAKDWPGIRIRIEERDGWLLHWRWEVTSGLNVMDYGLARTRDKAARKAERAAADVARRHQVADDAEVWEYDEQSYAPDKRTEAGCDE